MVKRRERGSVARMTRMLARLIRKEHTPGPSSQEAEIISDIGSIFNT